MTSGESFAQPPVYEQRSYIQNGESEDFFTKKYGRPAYEFVKPRYAFVGEYSVGIENTYRSINPEFRNIPIKEAFWNLNEDLNLTCFFHYKDGQWRVISYFFWPPDAKF
ncbi:hypothetical protein PH192_10390 [Escherichia coli]|nr:hypothetical protein [Escherichia coli]MBB8614537.1 hypothetical protein [Escherichia coli]WCB44548.1 hypothetical protein PH192_10390 [Escherichia coli]